METLELHFSSRVSTFLGRTGLSPTAFGRMALGDPNLVRQIERGRSLTLRSADRVLAFMDEHDRDPQSARAPPRPRRRMRTWARKTRRSTAMTEQPKNERTTNPPIRILRLPEVMARTGLSRSTIYVRLEQGAFPRPVALGGRAVGWIESEIDAWIRERIAESRGGEAGSGAAR